MISVTYEYINPQVNAFQRGWPFMRCTPQIPDPNVHNTENSDRLRQQLQTLRQISQLTQIMCLFLERKKL